MTEDKRPFVRTESGRGVSNQQQLEMMRGVLGRGLPFRFEALGFSMRPFIRHGDTLTVSPLFQQWPRAGDVIAFVQADRERLAVHRVVEVRAERILARGDACIKADAIVPIANALGVVTRVERDGREVRAGLGTEGRLIAWLNHHEWLSAINELVCLPLRPASAVMRRIQRLPQYRHMARILGPAFWIEEATPREMIEVYARLNPGRDDYPVRSRSNVTRFVARWHRGLLGYVALVRHPPESFPYVGAWISGLVVWGRFRGMGVGEALTRQVIEQARYEGAPEISLQVFADNQAGIAMYRKLGFEFIDSPEFERMARDERRTTGRWRELMRCRLQEARTPDA